MRPRRPRCARFRPRGAFLETNARPALGASVELRHPDAGTIFGEVRALADDGVGIGFDVWRALGRLRPRRDRRRHEPARLGIGWGLASLTPNPNPQP